MADRNAVRNGMLAVITAILGAAALRESYSVTMPLAVAVLLISAVWPLKPVMDRRLPSWLSYIIIAFILFVVLIGFVAAVYFAAAQIVRAFAQNWDQLEGSYQSIVQWADRWGLPIGSQQSYNRLIGFGQDLLSNAYTISIYIGFIAILSVLGLPEVGALKIKLARELDADAVDEVAKAVGEIGGKIRLYLGITTLTSLLTGIASTLWAFALGVDLALVWGVLNFLLNYIPVVGNLVGIIPPTVYALMQFQSWTLPAIVFVGFGVIQIVISNFVYPMLQGRSLSLSPIAIIVALAFWSWVWGVAGALIAVPLTVVGVIVCEHFRPTRWVAVLLSVPKADHGL